jgi:hypothetical protein
MENALAVFVALAVVVAVVLYAANRADFVVRLRAGRFHCSGRLSLAQRRALEQFLRDDLAVPGPVTIRGRRRAGRLSLWSDGSLTPGQEQRVRNFLLSHR